MTGSVLPIMSLVVLVAPVGSAAPDEDRNSTPGHPYVWHVVEPVLVSENPSSIVPAAPFEPRYEAVRSEAVHSGPWAAAVVSVKLLAVKVVVAMLGAVVDCTTVLVTVTVGCAVASELLEALPPHPAIAAAAAIAAVIVTSRRGRIASYFYLERLDSCGPQEQAVQAILAGQLGMEGERQDLSLTHGDRMAVDLSEHLDARPVLGDPGGADEDRVHRAAVDAGDLEIGLKGVQLAAKRVSLGEHVQHTEMDAVKDDHAGAGSEHRHPALREFAQRPPEALALDPERHRGRLTAREHQRVESGQVSRHADLACAHPEAAEHALVRREAPLQRQDPDLR
jgi:hypothetical protein